MKPVVITVLKSIIVITAILVLAGMVRFPLTEGRAAHLNLIEIYTDPLIIYCYIASIPFFTALFQAYKLLGYTSENKILSREAFNTVRNIKYCAIFIIGFLVGALIFIRYMARGDDPAGPTMLGLIAISTFLIIAVSTGFFQKNQQNRRDPN